MRRFLCRFMGHYTVALRLERAGSEEAEGWLANEFRMRFGRQPDRSDCWRCGAKLEVKPWP